MMYLYIAIALLVGLLLGKALFGKKAAPAPAGANDVACPLAAVVVAVNVKEGQKVKAGDLLVTLEAMKMNTPVNSPADGTVAKICVSAGQSVNEGEVLLSLS